MKSVASHFYSDHAFTIAKTQSK